MISCFTHCTHPFCDDRFVTLNGSHLQLRLYLSYLLRCFTMFGKRLRSLRISHTSPSAQRHKYTQDSLPTFWISYKLLSSSYLRFYWGRVPPTPQFKYWDYNAFILSKSPDNHIRNQQLSLVSRKSNNSNSGSEFWIHFRSPARFPTLACSDSKPEVQTPAHEELGVTGVRTRKQACRWKRSTFKSLRARYPIGYIQIEPLKLVPRALRLCQVVRCRWVQIQSFAV